MSGERSRTLRKSALASPTKDQSEASSSLDSGSQSDDSVSEKEETQK